MTDFVITPEDVGRVASTDDAFETEMVCVHVSEHGAVFEEIETFALYTFNLKGERTVGLTLTEHPRIKGWKPKLLEAPKRWWNVFVRPEGRLAAGDQYAHEHGSFDAAVEGEINTFGDRPIARIYAEHWHGCEEGRFDTPESAEE